MNKHIRAASLILAGLLTGVAGSATAAHASPAPSPADAVPITVAYHPNMHGGAIMAVAESQGYFQSEGLNVEPVRFTSGGPELSAMIAGQLDVGYLGPGALPAVLNGEVELLTIDHPNAIEYVLASKASGVAKPVDLKGKRVLFAAGTTGELVLREALKQAGLQWTDITPVNSPDESSLTAYSSGTAEVVSLGPTFTNQARSQVPSNDVFKSTDSADFALPGVWIANKDFVAKNRDLTDRFLRSVGKANDYRLEHLQDIVPEVAKYTGTPAADLQSQVELTKWWSTEEVIKATQDGNVKTMLEGLNKRFQDTGKMNKLADVSTYFNGEATVAAYETESEGAAARSEESQFPVIPVIIGVLILAFVVAGFLIIRRARA